MSERAQQPMSALLVIVGLALILAVWPLMQVWPSGWVWQPNQPEYSWMIIGVYATLGVFLLLSARDPARHRSLILFAGWSSLVHASIMLIQAIQDPTERGHFLGDITILAVVGILFIVFAPRSAATAPAG